MTTTPTVWKAPFKVNTTDAPGPLPNAAATNEQSHSHIVALTGGRVLAGWDDSSTNYSGLEPPDSVGQILDLLGAPVGGETYLSGVFGDGTQTNIDLAALSNGGFVVAYETQDFVGFGTGQNVTFQVFDSSGTAVSSRSNGTLPGQPEGVFQPNDQRDPAIVAFADDSFLIAYEDNTAGNSDIRGVFIDAAGAEQPSFLIADLADDAIAPAMARLNNGNLITVFQQNGAIRDIQFAIVTAAGAAVNSGTAASAASDLGGPDVAVLTGGNYVVTWTDDDGDGAAFDSGIKAQRFQEDGTATGGVIAVNVALAGIQDDASVVALADGGFFVAWTDSPSGDIRGQRFDASGVKIGSETASTGPGTASEADLSLSGDGRILLSFTNDSAGNKDVYTAILDPREPLIVGTTGADFLTSRTDGATVRGDSGADTLIGLGANDRLNGGLGADAMTGGGGDDAFYFDDAGDTAAEAAAGGTRDVVYSSVDIAALTAGIEFATLTGGGDLDITGNAEANIISGNSGANVLSGLAGGDRIFGNDGVDTLLGGADADILRGGNGGDTLDGGADADTLIGGDGGDRYVLSLDADRIVEAANQGTDEVLASVDLILAANVELLTAVGAGGRRFTGNGGDNVITGGAGADAINGGLGADTVIGGGSGDTLRGGGGDDRIDGGLVADSLFGDAGFDVFVEHGATGRDAIYDFAGGLGVGDRVELKTIAGGGIYASAAAAHAALIQQGANVLLVADADSSVLFMNRTTAQIAVDDFTLVA